MRLIIVVSVGLVSCGGTQPTVSEAGQAQWRKGQATQREMLKENCDQGTLEQCQEWGEQMLEYKRSKNPNYPVVDGGYALDPAAAKPALVKACNDGGDKPYWDYDPGPACEDLLLKWKLVSVDEAMSMCTSTAAGGMCRVLAERTTLTDAQWYSVCAARPFLCAKALDHLTSAAEKADADMRIKFEAVSEQITGYAARVDDDDSDSTASSDSACHKDTDCKGERICNAGSCVDPGAKPASKKASAELGVDMCDALASDIETKVFTCSKLHDAELETKYRAWRDAWGKVEPARRNAMAGACTVEMYRVARNLQHVHC